jgi:uncharacterized membrane protein
MLQIVDRRVVILGSVAAASAVWAAAIPLTPMLPTSAAWLGALPYLVGSVVCHQIPERSFHLAGAQLPVCARCTGLYLGAALGLALWATSGWRSRARWSNRTALTALAVSGAPTAFTVATAWLGIADPPNAWRAILAAPLGAIGGCVVGAVVTDHLK